MQQGLNDARKLGVAAQRSSDYRRFVMAIAENDVPRVNAIVQTALNNGASVRAILHKLELAVDGLYHVRGFTDRDYDKSILVYRMGGRPLAYAMSQAYGLPTLRTLRNHTVFVRVMPTIGTITSLEIDFNIKNVVLSRFEGNHAVTRQGASILIDEVALQEAAVHFRHCNKVGGLCWKHTHDVDLVLRTYDSAVNIAESLSAGKVHMGKEMTVAAVSFFNQSNTFPILAAPTCKHEDANDMEFIFKTLLDTWNSSAACSALGDIWSVATDGDATRRAAGHRLFLKQRLHPSSTLYPTLSGMAGMNLYVGDNDVTLDFDFKHIWKRLCTLIRSPSGLLLNGGRTITSSLLERYLVFFSDHTLESAKRLLHPDDAQDVPRAIDLMQGIITLSEIPQTTTDPDVAADLDSICYLSKLLEAILEPFINVEFSLSEQMVSLSRYAHLAFATFRLYRLAFMSNQLYFDSMTMVKNAFFCAAKQQQSNPDEPFWLFYVGDDRLEKLFGRLRMLGSHDSAMNYRQGIDRLGHAQDLDRVLSSQPDLDPGHRRLSTSRTEGLDHLNVNAWHGDTIADHCDLRSCWSKGRDQAIAILQKSQMPEIAAHFSDIFLDPEIDMLQPFGQGIYPGINTADAEDRSADTSLLRSCSTITPTVSPISGSPEPQPAGESQAQTIETSDDVLLTLDDALEEIEIPELSLPRAKGVNADDFVMYNGKPIHKGIICRNLITPNYDRKSNNRTDRVRGYSKYKKSWDLNDDSVTGDEDFIEGDLFVTLIRAHDTLSLAVVRSTAIRESNVLRKSLALATILNDKAGVQLEGQIMIMRQVPSLLTHSAGATDSVNTSPWSWVSTGRFATTETALRNADSVYTEKVPKISVAGQLTRVVNANIVQAEDHLSGLDTRSINSAGTVWELDEDLLSVLSLELWDVVSTSGIALTLLPAVDKCVGFPYLTTDGKVALESQSGSLQLANEIATSVDRACHFCGETISGPQDHWRGHIGKHLLHHIRGTGLFPSTPGNAKIGDNLPCGFCGHSGNPSCAIELSVTQRKVTVNCNCPYKVKISFGWAKRGTAASPSRNVPIVCTLCPHPPSLPAHTNPAIWSYNMDEHIRLRHSEYASPSSPVGLPIPASLWNDMEITAEEEHAVGIPVSFRPPAFSCISIESSDSTAAEHNTSQVNEKGGRRAGKRKADANRENLSRKRASSSRH
ncbi:hypothetical protein BV25DRAFT_1875223 [Artomyces pyxidatus]|uniref:Uncharacterized protein n=1 Tax=Artomyces pyxidatus TaxID=48021 RepID=A0ACB8TI24_9AGAM|nr:hypothetical protein BV25DRAFT_1875223 [Artomyces pyxidatus]